MSFYYDDDDDYHNTRLSTQKSDRNTHIGDDDDAFVCVNCGGTSSYLDYTTGALCCNSCFTQSQQPVANGDLDVMEVQALAARTRTGQFLSAPRGRSGRRGPAQTKKPFDEYDTSQPLPNVQVCLQGMQQVLKHGIIAICDCVGLDFEQQQEVKKTVHSLWTSYLRAWADGAEFYGELHPEIRFSLRDTFLNSSLESMVLRHLSYKGLNAVQNETPETADETIANISPYHVGSQPEQPQQQQQRDEETLDKEENNPLPVISKQYQRTLARHGKTYHQRSHLMQMYWDGGKRGRLEAALLIQPSLRLVACLLWLAVSRAGVTIHHVLTWIANGAIPLQNAFQHCLTNDEQAALHHVSASFRLRRLPQLLAMESLARRVVVACGLKSFDHLKGKHPCDTTTTVETTSLEQMTTVTSPTNSVRWQRSTTQTDFAFVTAASVPLLTARLVKDLGFGQHVLNTALALMGIWKEGKGAPPLDSGWLPAPLQGAHPDNLWSVAHVLAVIAVACKMTPGWETWTYRRPQGKSRQCKDDVDTNLLTERDAKRRRTQSNRDRFVPYNEQHFRLLGNGPLMEDYLDYLEDNILDDKNKSIFPKFVDLLSPDQANGTTNDSVAVPRNVVPVQPNPILVGGPNPNTPSNMWRRQKLHDWYLRLGKRRARWADANGLGEYVVYTDRATHASDRYWISRELKGPTPEPFHPQYGLLIEYMSYTANVKPSKIHAIVSHLDEEVMRLGRPLSPPKRPYKSRKKSYTAADILAEVVSTTTTKTKLHESGSSETSDNEEKNDAIHVGEGHVRNDSWSDDSEPYGQQYWGEVAEV